MNIDPKVIEVAGGTSEDLKKKFVVTKGKRDPKIEQLIDRHCSRIDAGVRRSLDRARKMYAIQRAYDVSQRQITYTMVQGLIDSNPGKESVQKLADQWGLSSMIVPLRNDNGQLVTADGRIIPEGSRIKPGYKLNLPTFFTIYLPLVLSYAKARWSKLYDDINLYPFYKYEPLVMTARDRAVSKVVTARVQRMVSDCGVKAAEREQILQSLLFSEAMTFPRERYWKKSQKIGTGEKVIQEGVRLETPHPCRTFRDEAYPATSINSDSGCEFGGYWTMVRSRDVTENKSYWNADKLTIGRISWRNDSLYDTFSKLFPCVASFPKFSTVDGKNDREASAFSYTAELGDAGVDLTAYFERLVPSEWGLYDYDFPVWHRFIYAGDRTVIFAEPLYYNPLSINLYDHSRNCAEQSSLALELTPFQDMLGNLISQYLLTIKKNLIRIVGVDQDLIENDEINRIINGTENALRGIEFVKFSGQEHSAQLAKFSDAFQPVLFQPQQTDGLLAAINMLLTMVERVMGFAPQEVGASATHEQSATEVGIASLNTATRVRLTASFRDEAMLARKKMLYYAMLHHGDDEILEQVSDLKPDEAKLLTSAGFDVTSDGQPGVYTVKGKKTSLVFDSFFSDRDGADRISDPKLAEALLGFLDRLASNPATVQLLGQEQIVGIINAAVDMLGLPDVVRIKENPQTAQADQQKRGEDQQAQLQQLQQIVSQMIDQQVTPALSQIADGIKTNVMAPLGQVAQQQQAVGQAVQALASRQEQDTQTFGEIAKRVQGLVDMMVGNQQPAGPGIPVQPDMTLGQSPDNVV